MNKQDKDIKFPNLAKVLREQSEEFMLLNQRSPGFGFKLPQTLRNWEPGVLARYRRNQKTLTSQAKNNFNKAVALAIADGKYQEIAHIHHEPHNFHTLDFHEDMQNPPYTIIGLRRFLPWHRAFVIEMENLLRQYVPGTRIPYWDWVNDKDPPSWVDMPQGVTRSVGGLFPPDQSEMDIIMSLSTYDDFSGNLEMAHNTVHNWVGGTMSHPLNSPQDPMFWLHHANVDRIWAIWQLTHPNEVPNLSGMDAVLTPWPINVSQVQSIQELGYKYL